MAASWKVARPCAATVWSSVTSDAEYAVAASRRATSEKCQGRTDTRRQTRSARWAPRRSRWARAGHQVGQVQLLYAERGPWCGPDVVGQQAHARVRQGRRLAQPLLAGTDLRRLVGAHPTVGVRRAGADDEHQRQPPPQPVRPRPSQPGLHPHLGLVPASRHAHGLVAEELRVGRHTPSVRPERPGGRGPGPPARRGRRPGRRRAACRGPCRGGRRGTAGRARADGSACPRCRPSRRRWPRRPRCRPRRPR